MNAESPFRPDNNKRLWGNRTLVAFLVVIPLLSVAVNKSVAQIITMLFARLERNALLASMPPLAADIWQISSVVQFAPLLVFCLLFFKCIRERVCTVLLCLCVIEMVWVLALVFALFWPLAGTLLQVE